MGTFESAELDLVRAIVYIHESAGTTISLLDYFIKQNVAQCETGQTLFRGANFASKAWSGWVRMNRGLQYIHSVLVNPMYEICSAYGEMSLELNPALVDEKQSTTVNKYHLMSSCQKIFDSILDEADSIPPQMRIVLKNVRDSVNVKFPDYSLKIVGAFIFLRYFCPCIASPL